MQTFLPEPTLQLSASILDPSRLHNQVNENLVIAASALRLRRFGESYVRLKAGEKVPWGSHPAVKMWVGYVKALIAYSECCILELAARAGRADSAFPSFDMTRKHRLALLYREACLVEDPRTDRHLASLSDGWRTCTAYLMPMFMGNTDFHESHRSNLIRKLPAYYRPLWPDVPDNLPYVWPTQRTNA